jgi:hypothetical protein
MTDLVDLLVGEPLNDFKVLPMTEVYSIDYEGRLIRSEGCLQSEVEAKAYAQVVDSEYVRTRSVLVLTNGQEGYFLGDQAVMLDTSAVLDAVREKALAKLTAEERQVLGL